MAPPKTVTLVGSSLAEAKKRLQDGTADPALQSALAILTKNADAWLTQGPWTVTSKSRPGPSGDIHDYVSQAPYYWPDPTKPDGLPYINRDGQKNPEVLGDYCDRADLEKVFWSAYDLALAWFYTGREAYAQHAANVLRTYFVTPATAMRPNLNHAQMVPGICTGRHIGIIDFAQAYASVLDAAVLLGEGQKAAGPENSFPWTAADDAGFREWNRQFLRWLVDSEFGRTEHGEPNNHGSFSAMLNASVAAYVGDLDQVRTEATFIRQFLAAAVDPKTGAMPAELRRTRSFHYSTFTLLALTRLAMVVQNNVGEDVWNDGIFLAIEFILPAASQGGSVWEYEDRMFQQFGAADVVRAAAQAGHKQSQAVLAKLEMPPFGDVWPVRPAPEQLDPVKSDADQVKLNEKYEKAKAENQQK